MAGATSNSLAIVTLLLLPFDLITAVLRFRIRLSRRVWGSDDWAMLISMPFLLATTGSMATLAWSGLGLRDHELIGEPMKKGLFWYFVSGTVWTFWVMTLKWSIGFSILRIVVGRRWVIWTIYIAVILMTLASASTGIFQMTQCRPMRAIWDNDALANGGECINRRYLAAMSTTLAAVSIATDWYMALIPIPLLWNIQMENRTKLSVVALLSLGVFASIAGIVRFMTIVKSTPAIATGEDYLHILNPIMTWAHAEPAIGMIAANLPALRPLLEKALNLISTLASHNKSAHSLASRGPLELELATLRNDIDRDKGNETRVIEGYAGDDGRSSVGDDESQTKIMRPDQGIRIERSYGVRSEIG